MRSPWPDRSLDGGTGIEAPSDFLQARALVAEAIDRTSPDHLKPRRLHTAEPGQQLVEYAFDLRVAGSGVKAIDIKRQHGDSHHLGSGIGEPVTSKRRSGDRQ